MRHGTIILEKCIAPKEPKSAGPPTRTGVVPTMLPLFPHIIFCTVGVDDSPARCFALSVTWHPDSIGHWIDFYPILADRCSTVFSNAPDDTRITSGSDDKTIWLWDVKNAYLTRPPAIMHFHRQAK